MYKTVVEKESFTFNELVSLSPYALLQPLENGNYNDDLVEKHLKNVLAALINCHNQVNRALKIHNMCKGNPPEGTLQPVEYIIGSKLFKPTIFNNLNLNNFDILILCEKIRATYIDTLLLVYDKYQMPENQKEKVYKEILDFNSISVQLAK